MADGGCLRLARDGKDLDSICWGTDAADPAVLSRGGRAASEAEGSSLGRAPDSVLPEARTDWRSFLPSEATPGTRNQFQGVVHGLPMSGATVAPGQVTLMWYSMAGATGYRLRIGSEPALATLSTDVTVPGGVAAGSLVQRAVTLATGVYQWSVTALYQNGESTPSPVQAVFVRAPGAASARAEAPLARVASTSAVTEKELAVPLLYNHRDTNLLAVEAPEEVGAKSWDQPWQPKEGPFCARASIAMVTKYYRGDLSQDRISYEAFKDFSYSPRFDLYIGGFSGGDLLKGMTLAVGGYKFFDITTLETFMSTVKREIDLNRPIIGSSRIHVWVIIGYGEDDRGEYIVMNDPALGRYEMVIKPSPAYEGAVSEFVVDHRGLDLHLLMPTNPVGTFDEPEIRQDSDGDGVMDFDETRRFGTMPGNSDSDSDGVPDKAEIRAWVWDQQLGWARGTRTTAASAHDDDDNDTIPMQMDPDSDNGGCLDGLEDLDHDGDREEPKETSTFKPEDDRCVSGKFVTQIDRHSSNEFQDTDTDYKLSVTFSLKPKDDGTLEGIGAVDFFTFTHDVSKSSSDGGCESFLGPLFMSWPVKLTGRVIDGVMSLEADPPLHPFTATITGSCGADSFLYEATAFHGWADINFTDGVYEYKVDTPYTAPNSGHSLVEMKMEQQPPD